MIFTTYQEIEEPVVVVYTQCCCGTSAICRLHYWTKDDSLTAPPAHRTIYRPLVAEGAGFEPAAPFGTPG